MYNQGAISNCLKKVRKRADYQILLKSLNYVLK